jgi:sensor c-di-GMP phosphodiesterase-like protein
VNWTRNSRVAAILTGLLATTAVAVPVFIAIRVAHSQALSAERDRVDSYSREVLRRIEASADQGDLAIKQLVALVGPGGDPCSEKARDLMQALDLSSQYIQAVGAMSGNRVLCVSLGKTSLNFDLGPPDFTSPAGVHVRNHVTFDFDIAKTVYVVNERDGFAVILNRDLVIDITSEPAVVLGTFSYPAGEVTRSRGELDSAWIDALLSTLPKDNGLHGEGSTFVANGQLVSVVTSPKRFVGAVSAISTTRVDDRARQAALLLVPLGAVAGLVLAGAVLYLARLQLALPSVLKTALRRKEFFLHYQPVVDLQTGRWVGAEALIRWRRPNGEMVRPDVFVPVAEDAGLSGRLTAHVFELVEPDLRKLAALQPDFVLAVNVTPADLHTAATVDACRALIAQSGVRPASLSIEATERGFLDPAVAAGVIQQLRDLGVRVVIDDFGTGYSSLAYLHTLQVDAIKIDKAFVDTLGTDAPTSQVVFHIIEMAKDLKLEMVAEGVEHEAQATALRARGVQKAQGWLYSAALPFEELLAGIAAPTPREPSDLPR